VHWDGGAWPGHKETGGGNAGEVPARRGLPVNEGDPIPDELAARLGAPPDVSRRALEAFAVETFRAGRLTQPEVRQLLGIGTRGELDGFLKAHGLFEDYTLADLEQEREDLRRLGF
jgi:hypothetical protein